MERLFTLEYQTRALRREIERKMKMNDIAAMLVGLGGVIVAFYEYDLFYGRIDWSYNNDGSFVGEVEEEQYSEDPENTVLRVIVGISSLVLISLLYNHYRLKLELYKAKQRLEMYDTLKSSGMLYYFLIEAAYCLIHTPPGFNWVFEFEQHGGSLEYSLDMIICLVMLGRVYLLWRLFISYSSWNDERATEICNSCYCEGGVGFALKAELKERPYLVVFIELISSILILGLALRTAEQPFMHQSEQDWNYLWNGMWCIIITMTTVGFGDFFPSTHLGRVIGVFACFWGTFLVSLMVVSLSKQTEFNPNEHKAYEAIMKEQNMQTLRVRAADAIKAAIKLKICLKGQGYVSEGKKNMFINKFKRALIQYREFKRIVEAGDHDAPLQNILSKLNEKIVFGLNEIKEQCGIYQKLLDKLNEAENYQALLASDIDTLCGLNTTVIQQLNKIRNK